jgi:poly(A) polymerase
MREAGRRIAERLRGAGFIAYFAGGCVRDRLLGLEPEDYDIATDATPDAVQRLFPAARGVGEAFGVMLVRGDRHVFEVATFRSDLVYADGRRPTGVRFATPKEDAERRDFTINGLFEDPESGEIIDFVGGREDLERRVLRAIGDPAERFAEDHLRLLRAVRFAARFGLAIDERTALAMAERGPLLAKVARERIGAELRRMLEDPTRATARDLLERFAFDAIVLDEPHRRSGEDRVGQLGPVADAPLALVAWGLDRVGPGLGAEIPADAVARWRDALCLSNAEVAAIAAVLAARRGMRGFAELRESARKRLAAGPGFASALRILEHEASPLAYEVKSWLAGLGPEEIAPPRLVDGRDLLERGLAAGPRFRDLLDAVYDAQLEGLISSRAEALRFLDRRLAEDR